MGKYIVRRLLLMIPVLLGTTFLIYVMVFALPGDPTDNKCGERPCSPAYIAAFRAKYNLDDPLPLQYIKYMGNVLQGDFGTNQRDVPVLDDIIARYPTTVKLALMAVVIQVIIGILAGVLSGVRKGKFIDQVVLVSTLLLISVPIFVIGSTSQLVFGLQLGIFPISVPTRDASLYDFVLPAFVLASASVAYIARLTRTNLVDNLRADYVRTAKAKGLTRARTVGIHTLRNSMIPGHHLHRLRPRRPARRVARDRAHLQHQRRRRLPLPGDPCPGRRGHRGHGDPAGARLSPCQPARRPDVRRARSQDQP